MSSRIVAVILTVALATGPVLAGSSNSLMDVSPDGSRLLVTNADNGTVTVVDVAGKKKLREIAVGEKPEGVTWIGSGPLAAVTVYRDDLVAIVDTVEGKVVKKLKVAGEPYGIVALRDGSRAYVTHEYPAVVSEIDLRERKVVREIPVGSMIRGVALSADEKVLYVTEFYTGSLHGVDLASGKVVDTWKGQSVDNLSRHVVIHPRRPKAYLAHIRSIVDRHHGAGSIFPHLTVYDLNQATKANRRTSLAMDTFNGVIVVTNPWETALTPDGKKLYVIYAGTNDMNICDVIDDDYKEIERHSFPIRLGQNPRAIRVSPDGRTVFVSNALDFDVTYHDPDTMRVQGRVKVCEEPKSKEWVQGKRVFNSALPPLTSRKWIACVSCHPDGHSDGRVWQQPEGLRKTPPLMGLAHTHPLHWSADRDEVQDFEYTLRGRLMQGRGLIPYSDTLRPKVGFQPVELEEKTSGRSADLDAMAVYTNSFEFTLSPHISALGKLSAAGERGKALFHDKTVNCASCHSGPYYTDSSLTKPFKLHDVGTGQDDSTEKIGAKYDTPTLLGVYRAPPYLHHGKAKTLLDVLTTCNKDDKHGKTSQLKPEQLDDLVAFLKALPYEKPPSETPNTIKYRFVPKSKD